MSTKTVSQEELEEYLLEYLSYNPDTGLIHYNKGVKGRKKTIDQPMGTVSLQGYLTTTAKGKQLKVHRLAWFLHYGVWPNNQMDHINKDKTDNRIANLRDVDHSLQQHNRDMPTPTSGLIGAHFNKAKGKWKSSIRVGGKSRHLGYFDCPTAAHLSYMVEKEKVLNG